MDTRTRHLNLGGPICFVVEHYVIRGGARGVRPTLGVGPDRWPDTEALFNRAGLRTGMRCIDLGCGGGEVTLEMEKIVAPTGKVIGIDMGRGEGWPMSATPLCRTSMPFRIRQKRNWRESKIHVP